ncbi:MAG: LptF/LptG family permease [Vicinamibacterales bacterium]
MKTLDRYLVRETLMPFLLALAVFTFVLQINPILDQAQKLLAKGVPLGTVGYLLLLLIPQALGLTIPIAFLTGLLIALGRLSADRESVALLACGVSPRRLLRPILVMALVAAAADVYVLTSLIADSNQAFREITYRFLAQQSEADIKPRLFYEGFPGKVLLINDEAPGGGWKDVLLADTTDQSKAPTVFLGEGGRLVMNEADRQVDLYLTNAYQYAEGANPESYEATVPASGSVTRLSVPADAVFGPGEAAPLMRGNAEKKIAQLREEIREKPLQGMPPHNEVIFLNQMFSFPVACLVFAPIGLVLGLHTRTEGKLAGLTQGLAIVFLYYAVMTQAEAWTKGYYSGTNAAELWLAGHRWPAYMARWWPNITMGLVGVAALWWRSRPAGASLPLRWPTWLRVSRPEIATVPGGAPGAAGAPAEARVAPAGTAAPRRPPGQALALVIRAPRFGLPRPRILDTYVSSRYLRLVLLSFVALLGLVYLGAFLDRIDKLFKGQATAGLMAEFLVYATPQFIAFILPIATLVAVLGTIGGLTRTGELTVMRACGVSLYRAAMPLLFLAVVWSGILFLLDDRVVARANQHAEALDDVIRGRPPHTQLVAENRHWLAGRDGRIYYYQLYDRANERLLGLSVFEPTRKAPYRLLSHTHAAEVAFEDGRWVASRGWVQTFAAADRSTHDSFEQRELSLESPAEFASAQVDAEVMTYGELRDHIAKFKDSGFSLAEQRMNLERKLAFPAVTLIMTLLAVPFGVTTGRRGALYGVGLAIVLAFSYFLLTAFFAAAGSAEVLPPVLAAWAPNLLFATAALYLTLRVRT